MPQPEFDFEGGAKKDAWAKANGITEEGKKHITEDGKGGFLYYGMTIEDWNESERLLNEKDPSNPYK